VKKLEPDATALLRLFERWRNEAVRAGRPISRIALAYEAGRDGFWLARLLPTVHDHQVCRGTEHDLLHAIILNLKHFAGKPKARAGRSAGPEPDSRDTATLAELPDGEAQFVFGDQPGCRRLIVDRECNHLDA
jgi:hypothetical protein